MHHIQKTILIRLGFAENLRFSELKPDELESKLFTYHLKQTVRDGFVGKSENGLYNLTSKGKQWGVRALTEPKGPAKAHSVLFLLVRRKTDGAWLLYKRLVHPLKDRVGFMHASPVPAEDITVTARTELLLKTGLNGTFDTLGSGYSTMLNADGAVESFTHYELLVCVNAEGELNANHDRAEYFWEHEPDWQSPEMLPNMPDLVHRFTELNKFFSVKTYSLSTGTDEEPF